MSTTTATQYLDVPGGRLAYDDTESSTATGTGTPVVLLPGMLSPRTTYRHLTPLLAAAGHRVITMDLRGFGESSIAWDDYSPATMTDDVLALLDHLGIERAVLVGHSYTGATVVRAATVAPERVAGIVLLSAFVENLPPNAFQRALLQVAGAALVHIPASWGLLQRFYYPTAKPADHAEFVKAMVADLRTPGRKTATKGHVTGDAAPIGWCAAVTRPALVIMGTKDIDFPDAALIADRQAGPMNARKVMIDGAGHYAMAEFPEATADALLPFLHEVA